MLVVYKASCPTCQLVVPILETLYRRSEGQLEVVAVSQDEEMQTSEFVHARNLTMPVLMDHPGYKLSSSLGLTAVPMMVLLDGREIVSAQEGFDREDLRAAINGLARGKRMSWDPSSLMDDESLPAFKPG